MPRKASGWLLGIVGLALLFLCGGAAAAQEPQQVPAQAGQAPGQSLSTAEAANLQSEVTQLRAELSQLRQEVTQLRAQVEGAQPGTGGSGVPPGARVVSPRRETTEPEGTEGAGAPGAASGAPPAGPNAPSPSGKAVVDAVYTGVVRSVGEREVALALGSGPPLTLHVDPRTRVQRDGRNISLRQLEPGEHVRAVVNLLDNDRTMEISVLPSAPGK